MNFYDLSSNLNESLREEAAAAGTTMDAISYLPSQVGTVKASMKGLKKVKNQWNIEILEGDKVRTVCFEDKLQIHVPNEHWNSFNQMFDNQLTENSYLDLTNPLFDSDEDEDVLETRIERLRDRINEQFELPIVRALDTIATKWVQCFTLREDLTASEPVAKLAQLGEGIEALCERLFDEDSDLGSFEIIEKKILDSPLNERIVPGNKCLAACRYLSQFGGTEMIFEAQVDFDLSHQLSIQVDDPDVVDAVEESVVNLRRIRNVFYPKIGQTQPVIEAIIETIDCEDDDEPK